MMKKYSADIEPRHLRFSFSTAIPKYWHSGSVIKTYHFNALAIFLPLLERMVVLSLKQALREVSDPLLKEQVASLVAQEAIHGREFHHYNQQCVSQHFQIQSQDYPLRFFRVITAVVNRFSRTFHYALSAAGEHFTAIAADLFLRDPTWFEGVPPEQSAIWRWHCIEEIEHKCVAFDVFKAVNGNYFIRILGMLMMTGVFSALYFKPIWHMMKKDKNHGKISLYFKFFQYYWGKKGLIRTLFKPYFDYFKPRFHPNDHQNNDLIAEWKIFFKASSDNITQGLQSTVPPFTRSL